MATKYEYHDTGELASYSFGDTNWIAMTFTPQISHSITSVKLKIRRHGSPGIITISIRATDGSVPTGADLTSGTIDGDELTTTSTWTEIAFAAYALSASTKYAIVMRTTSAEPTYYASVRGGGTAYPRGEYCYSADSGVGWTAATSSIMFEEWGVTGLPTVTTQECTNTTAQESTGHGLYSAEGDSSVTQHGHCWSTSPIPTTADSKTENGAAPNLGQFQSSITRLTPGTTYYARAYAINTEGTSYGSDVTITTGTTIGRRHIWIEGKELHYWDGYGDERKIEGVPDTSGLPWWYYTGY